MRSRSSWTPRRSSRAISRRPARSPTTAPRTELPGRAAEAAAVARVRRQADQVGMELPALAGGERAKEVGLRRPRCLRRPRQNREAARGQLNSMTSPIRRIGRAMEKATALKVVQQRDDVRRLDSERGRQLALSDRTLGVEMMQDGVLGPSETALAEAAAQSPGGRAREPQNQETRAGAGRRVRDVRVQALGGGRIHFKR